MSLTHRPKYGADPKTACLWVLSCRRSHRVPSLRAVLVLALLIGFSPIPSRSVAALPGVTILRSDASGLELEVSVPLEIEGGDPVRLNVPGWEKTSDPAKPALPYLAVPLVVPAEGGVTATITAQIDTFVSCSSVEMGSLDRPIGLEGDASGAIVPLDSPNQLVSVSVAGVVRDVRMARLVISPVTVAGNGVRWMRSLRVLVRYGSTGLPRVTRASGNDAEDHPAAQALNADMIPAFRSLAVTPPAAGRPAATSSPLRLRFYVRYEGIYRITGADLRKWSQNSSIAWETIDPRTFKIEESGTEIPIYVEGEERGVFQDSLAIEFYARPNVERYRSVAPDLYRDPFVEMGIYNLSWGRGPGARLADEDGSLTTAADSPDFVRCQTYWNTVHAEEDRTFERFGGANEDLIDRYIWQRVGHGETANFPIELESPVNGSPPTIEVMARGATFSRHIMEVRLEGTRVGTVGISPILRDLDLVHFKRNSTSVILQDGTNTLSVITGDPSSPDPNGNDVIAMNWFEVTYERSYAAKNNSILFRRPAEPSSGVFDYELSGFATPDVSLYKIGVSRLRNFTTVAPQTSRANGYTIRFQDRIDGGDPRYIALTGDRKLKPERVTVVPAWERPLADRTRAADYLIVTHSVLIDTVSRFADYRRSAAGGQHTVAVVDVAQIFDEFGHGYPAAEPVKEFLTYAFNYWSAPSLRYVALVGDGVMRYPSDNMGLLAYPLIPAFLEAQARWGGTETDHPYSLLAGEDLLPDIHVGRIPASSTTELRAAVDKIIEFEQGPELSKWRNSILLVSEGEAWFVAQHEFLGATIPAGYFQRKLYNGATTAPHLDVFFGRRSESLAHLNHGSLWTVYLGHGGGGVWGSDRLLVHADPPTLQNAGRAGVVLSMTCFTGAFAGVTQKSLAEMMLFSRGGAIAWLGASSVGWVNNDFYFAQSIFRAAFASSRERQTLGSIISAAKTDYLMRYGGGSAARGSIPHSIVHEYNLIGDPALQIAPPSPQAVLTPSTRTPALGQQVTVNGVLPQSLTGTATVALFDDSQFEVAPSVQVPVSNGAFSASFAAPTSLVGTGLTAKTYVAPSGQTGPRDWSGFARMAVADLFIDSVTVARTSADSFFVSAAVYGSAPVQTVACSLVVNSAGTFDYVPMSHISGPWYRTTRALDFGNVPSGDVYAFAQPIVKATDTNGRVAIRRDIPALYPNARASLKITSTDLVGDSRGELSTTIANTGTIPSDSVIARAWLVPGAGDRALLSEVRLTPLASQTNPISDGGDVAIAKPSAVQSTGNEILPQYARTSFLLPDSLLKGQEPGKQVLISATSVDGRSIADSVLFTIPASFGVYSLPGSSALRVAVPSEKFSAEISAGAFTGETLVALLQTAAPQGANQPDVQPLTTGVGGATNACDLRWLADVAPTNATAVTLTLQFDKANAAAVTALSSGRLRVGYWNANREQWETVESQGYVWAADTSSVTVPTPRIGVYSFILIDDVTPPVIEVSARGQQFGEGAYVNPFTKFVVLAEDRNGIATGKEAVRVWIDGIQLADSLITFPSHPGLPAALPVTVSPPLLTPREAPYTMRVAVRDAVGNLGERTVSFRVAGQTVLEFYGNFPNPFGSDGTVFAFSFSAQISEVTFRIYDLAGRLVLKFSNYDLSALYPDDVPSVHRSTSPYRLLDRNGLPLVAPSYHELEWSGRNSRGEQLANGVYFGIITVRDEAGDEVARRTFKMVKAE